jgi:hypothetical protein
MTRTAYKYRVWDAGTVRRGTAKEILDSIRRAANNPEIKNMSAKQYADALVEDAPYFLDQDLLRALQSVDYPTEYDRALHYLAVMPSSRVRILTEESGSSKRRLAI